MQFPLRNLMQIGNLHHFWKLCNDFWYNAIWQIPGLVSLWKRMPEVAHRKISLASGIHCCSNFFLFLLLVQCLYIVKTMCNTLKSSFQTGSSSSPSYCHIFFLIAVLDEDSIRNIIQQLHYALIKICIINNNNNNNNNNNK
jgi:hypothetical protein